MALWHSPGGSPLRNYLEIHKTWKQCNRHKTCVPFISTNFVQNVSHSSKYLAIYVQAMSEKCKENTWYSSKVFDTDVRI
jgi:hypothetical protein